MSFLVKGDGDAGHGAFKRELGRSEYIGIIERSCESDDKFQLKILSLLNPD